MTKSCSMMYYSKDSLAFVQLKEKVLNHDSSQLAERESEMSALRSILLVVDASINSAWANLEADCKMVQCAWVRCLFWFLLGGIDTSFKELLETSFITSASRNTLH